MTAAVDEWTAGRLFHARHPLPTPGGRTRRSTNRLRLVADRHLAASDERIHQAQRAAAAANLAAARTMRDELLQSAKDRYLEKSKGVGIVMPVRPTYALVGSVRRARRWPWPKWTWTVKDAYLGPAMIASGTARDEVTARRAMFDALDQIRSSATTNGLGDLS